MMHIDTISNKLLIGHIHNYGESRFVWDLTYDKKSNRYKKHMDGDTSMIGYMYAFGKYLHIIGDTAILEQDSLIMKFRKIKLPPILDYPDSKDKFDFIHEDIYNQVRSYYSNSLLNFLSTEKTDSTEIIFTIPQLKKLIKNNEIHMFCLKNNEREYNNFKILGDNNNIFYIDYYKDFIIVNMLKMNKLGPFTAQEKHVEKKQIFYRK